MNYKVRLQKSDEGYSVSCPGLPGCWSQGETEAGSRCRTSATQYPSILRLLTISRRTAKSAKSKFRFSDAKLSGINHLDAVRALEKASFRIVRQGKHIVMSDGARV